MKIVVICRTRNESRNIARFCLAYSWADAILIADGGSTDNTLDIARQFDNVKVELFTQKVHQNDHWRNPHGRHINFMIDWALREKADWIIFDDCDCVPTLALQADIRGLLSDTDKTVCQLYRLYVWGSDKPPRETGKALYFPDLNKAGQSLWGWRSDVPVRALEDNPWSHDIIPCWNEGDVLNLEHPHCCLHYFCPDLATVERKLTFYRESGEQPEAVHPLEGCGSLALLPDWAKWR